MPTPQWVGTSSSNMRGQSQRREQPRHSDTSTGHEARRLGVMQPIRGDRGGAGGQVYREGDPLPVSTYRPPTMAPTLASTTSSASVLEELTEDTVWESTDFVYELPGAGIRTAENTTLFVRPLGRWPVHIRFRSGQAIHVGKGASLVIGHVRFSADEPHTGDGVIVDPRGGWSLSVRRLFCEGLRSCLDFTKVPSQVLM